MDKIITALKSLISDIESMQSLNNPERFGGFSQYEEEEEPDMFVVRIEWPNMAISTEQAKKALAEYEASQVSS